MTLPPIMLNCSRSRARYKPNLIIVGKKSIQCTIQTITRKGHKRIGLNFLQITPPRQMSKQNHRVGEGMGEKSGFDLLLIRGTVMKANNLIVGQKINPDKQERAKQFRREMTPEEKVLWYHLRSNKLNGLHFRKQQVIDGFIADFYCHAAGVVIETDGGIHEQQKEYDAERDLIISSRGIQVIRIRNEEIKNDIYHVIQRILQVCQSTKSFKPTPIKGHKE